MVLKIHLPLIKSLAAIEVLCVLVACSGDSPRPPIVTNHTEAWDEQLARERREREMQTPLETPHVIAGKGYGFEEKDEERKHSVISPIAIKVMICLPYPYEKPRRQKTQNISRLPSSTVQYSSVRTSSFLSYWRFNSRCVGISLGRDDSR